MADFSELRGHPLESFAIGQRTAGAPNPLGIAISQILNRFNEIQQTKLGQRMKLEQIGAEAHVKGQAELETQKQLFPLKEQAALNLLREKARLFQQQPKQLSGETAGRLSLASQGEAHANQALRILFPTGTPNSFNRGLAVRIHSPFGIGMIGNQEAQSLEFNLKRAIDAQLRAETGATARPEELDRLTKEFVANAVANPQAAFERLQSLGIGLGKTRRFIDPTGQYSHLGTSPFEPMQSPDVNEMSDEEILQALGF